MMGMFQSCHLLVPSLSTPVPSITDTFEAFTLSLLSSLMISGPNSPFYKALLEPNIGTDFSSVVGCVSSREGSWLSLSGLCYLMTRCVITLSCVSGREGRECDGLSGPHQ